MQALFSRKLQAMQKNRMPAIRWELAHIRIASILFFYRATARDRGDSRGCMAQRALACNRDEAERNRGCMAQGPSDGGDSCSDNNTTLMQNIQCTTNTLFGFHLKYIKKSLFYISFCEQNLHHKDFSFIYY